MAKQGSALARLEKGVWKHPWGVALAVVAFALCLFRARYGLDLTDEAFYLAPGLKLLSLGDRAFADEIYNGPRHSDLLNYLFIRPLIPYSVLAARWAAICFYTFALFGFFWIAFRKRLNLITGLLFVFLLCFDAFHMPAWSYNWWARDALLLHHLFCWWGAEKSGRGRFFLFAVAGGCLGLAVVAHNPLLVTLPISLGLLMLVVGKGAVLSYLAGAGLVIGIDAAYLFQPLVFRDWMDSLRELKALHDHELPGATPLKRLLPLLIVPFVSVEFWLVAGLGIGARFLGKLKKTQRMQFANVIALSCLGWVLLRIISPPAWSVIQSTFHPPIVLFLGLGIGIGVAGIALSKIRSLPFVLIILGFASMLVMGVSSVNRSIALFWMIPCVAVPGAVLLLGKLATTTELKGAVLPFVALLFYASAGVLRYSWSNSYYEVPPSECTTDAGVAPFKGIKTSERRAFLTQELAKVSEGHPFVLGHVFLSGIFLLHETRSAVPTTLVSHDTPYPMLERFLIRMRDAGRAPSLVVQTKLSPWGWGVPFQGMYYNAPLAIRRDNPFVRFTECAKVKEVMNYEEFVATEVSTARMTACVNQVLAKQEVSHREHRGN